MLQDIRDKSQGIVVKIIVGFIVVTFALFGVDALVTGFTTSDTVAEVDGTEIKREELLQTAEMQRRQLIAMMGTQINPALLDDNLLQRRALEELIQRALLTNNAEKLNLSVSDEQVTRYLLEAEQFQIDGQFNSARYFEFIRSLGYTPLSFKDRVKQDLLLQQPRNVFANANFVLDSEVDLVSKLQNQQRTYEYVRLSLAEETEKTNITETEVEDYFAANRKNFIKPEQVKLDYIILSSVDFQEKVTITDDELRTAYNNAIATESPEERLASHILIETGEDRSANEALVLAEELKQQLDTGVEFAELAKEYSDDLGSKADGGSLGYVTPGMMVEEFEETLFSMAEGQISDVIETEFGYHIIELKEIASTDAPSYESMEAELRQTLLENKARQAMIGAQEDILDLAYASDDLTAIATEYNAEILQSDWFGRQGGDELISQNSQVVTAAFSSELLEENLNSDLIELNEEQIAIVHKNDYQPEEEKTLVEARDEIFQILLQEKALQSLTAQAESIKENPAAVKDWQVVEAANRGNDEITTLSFDLAHPQAEPTIAIKSLQDGDLVVLKLNQVIEGEISSDEIQRDYIKRYLSQSNTELLTNAHQQVLQSLADIDR
ncbi:peptidylprolyl isomerase [Marinomonas agarivorans]|nr:peptidylprolyl isomerase [Marinomonas agarivorans]